MVGPACRLIHRHTTWEDDIYPSTTFTCRHDIDAPPRRRRHDMKNSRRLPKGCAAPGSYFERSLKDTQGHPDTQGHSKTARDFQGHSRTLKDSQAHSRTRKETLGHSRTFLGLLSPGAPERP